MAAWRLATAPEMSLIMCKIRTRLSQCSERSGAYDAFARMQLDIEHIAAERWMFHTIPIARHRGAFGMTALLRHQRCWRCFWFSRFEASHCILRAAADI